MRSLAVAAAVAAAFALAVPAGRAADECNGLMRCIPVAGPWVEIPAPSPAARYPTVYWRLKCPVGVVGGLDARLSDRAIDVRFFGALGSPVNPGITTSDEAVFVATYTGRARRVTSFRPFIGCIPASGGGRTPTGASSGAAFRPGKPAVLRVRTLRLVPGRLGRTTLRCAAGERLVSSSHAVGLYTQGEPRESELGLVRVIRVVRGGRILVSASRQDLPPRIRAEVQIHAVCAR